MANTKPLKTVYRHIKTVIHIHIIGIVVFSLLFFVSFLFWLGVVVELILIIGLIRAIVVDITEYIELEDHCVNVHTGLFFQRNNRVPYTKMNSIDITNFFGFHNLEIDAGNDVSEIKFRWIQDAHQLKTALDQKLMINNYYQNSQKNDIVHLDGEHETKTMARNYPQQNYQPPHQQTAQEHMEKNIQELNQLAYLRSKGVITAQEFEMQKRKILNN